MEIQHYLHEHHPLTLCEINDDGEILCYGCGKPYSLGESYYCKKCRFYPRRCIACDKTSGSFYICKQCWPKSPLLHKSCADVPKEIQIAYRPHCFLRFEEESSTLNTLDCDFCKKTHRGSKFSCDVCGFQIGFGCAAMLIKYHDGREHVEYFGHRHPLTILKVDEYKMICDFCHKKFNDSCHGCAPCDFLIYNSCREWQQEIHHPFHPRHCLILKKDDELVEDLCRACCSDLEAFIYRCEKCDFYLHPECTTRKPSIKYSGHGHLVTLVENMSYKSQCEACGFTIQGVFFLRCMECCLDFHVRCGPQPLPSTIVHKQHRHPLNLQTETQDKADSGLLLCDACEEERKPEHPFYSCAKCKYSVHVRCVITEVQFDGRKNFRHFSHPHTLVLHEDQNDVYVFCYGCKKRIQGLAYGCDPCIFYLHKSCAELPTDIYHHSHQHYLTLHEYYAAKRRCDTCDQYLNGFTYHCDICKFELELDCVSQHPSINLMASCNESKYLEDQEKIGHFSHHHPLVIVKVDDMNCELCNKNIHGESYGCTSCKFYIHKSCGELLTEIIHPFHPRHSLKLRHFKEESVCDACQFKVEDLRYRCDECWFDLHPECTYLRPNVKHKGHDHPLTLIENMSYQSKCEACSFEIQSTFFLRCVECCLDFHVQCGPHSLPLNVMHKQHKHQLTLNTEALVKKDLNLLLCDVCQKERNPEHPVYYCAKCKYYAHVRCVITGVQLDKREKLRHFSHEHFLFLFESSRNNDVICSACEEDIQGDLAYCCDHCKFYLHKSCAELPREKQHPFHKYPLTLPEPYIKRDTKCDACHKNFNGFTYSCQGCEFHLDIDCSLLHPSIKFEGHEHILTFFKKLYDTPECKNCRLTTPDKFTSLDFSYFRCVTCDYNVHFLCSPLPAIIEHESHHHLLTLRDNFVELFDFYFDHEYYCDFCETKRDVRECVYYCEECTFVVDIGCVFSEVMLCLEGKRGDVRLRCIDRDITRKVMGKGLAYKDMLGSLTEAEKKAIQRTVEDIDEEFKELNQKAAGYDDEAIAIISRAFSDWTKDSFQSMAIEYGQGRARLEELDEDKEADDQVIEVGDYTITSQFAPVLRNLLDKHGDFGAGCGLNKRLKTIPLVTFCATVQDMCNTKVTYIDDDSISNWWYHLKLVQRSGFRIDFAFDHFKKILRAYSLTNIEISRNSPLYELHEEIAEFSEEIDERRAKIEMRRKGVEEIISGYGSERSRLEAKHLSDALELRWKNVATGLL